MAHQTTAEGLMLTAESACRIDSVDILELSVDKRTSRQTMVAKYTLCNSITGVRMGGGQMSVWSDKAATALDELLRALEVDICAQVFEATSPGGATVTPTPTDGVPSL